MSTTNKVTATDNVIDLDTLVTVTGGVKPGPNGEGCTGPFPRPRPLPNPGPFPRPLPGGPITDPAQPL